MSLKKVFIAFALFFAMLGFSGATFATEAKVNVSDTLKEVDAKIQIALEAVPAGNAEQLTTLIADASEKAKELDANYKFDFERTKVQKILRKARDAARKSDFPGAAQELKAAREGFANLKSFI
jgi:hypothetical protein